MHETNQAPPGRAGRHKTETASARDGILLVDKPPGMSSAAVVNRIKRLAGVRKAGHAGTLDPFATGVLVCPVNRATRLARFFLHGRKKYTGVLRLGMQTDTLDCTGRVVAQNKVPELTEEQIRQAVHAFTGKIEQVPPAFSALKHNGVPLYKYARAGRPVEKPPRSVEIIDIRVTRIDLPDIGFEVTCSGGTYIRTLCADIGESLGCGGHLHALTRTESCGFAIGETAALGQLEALDTPAALDRFLVPMAAALRGMPAYTADAALAGKIRHGRPILDSDLPGLSAGAGGFVKVTDSSGRLLAVIEGPGDNLAYSYCCVFHSDD